MSFLSPLWLLLGSAAAIPVLIHLLRRRIGARVEFPAARYLARAEKEHSRQLKLRNLLLMLLRVFALLAIAVAAARPVARLLGAGHAPLALAIVLDNSLSTSAVVRGKPVFDGLAAAARDALARASASDRVWLVTADGRVAGGSPAGVRVALDRVRPLASAGDLPAAVTRAAALVRSTGVADRTVAVLSDGQRSAWSRTVQLGDVRPVAYLPADPPPVNRSVRAVEARPARWTPDGAVWARIVSPRDSATFRATIAGRTLARGTVPPDSASVAQEVQVRAAPAERGWVAGTVELEPDELRGDDVRHFAAWIGPAPKVSADPSAGPFASGAVDALIQGRRAAAGGDVVIVPADRLSRIPPAALILAPSDPVRVGAANRALESAGIPWRLGAERRGAAGVTGPRLDGVTAVTRYALALRGVAPADTLARAGVEPWIVAGPGYVLIASPLDPAATDLPLRASWMPWLADVLAQRLAAGEAGGGRVIAAVPGATVTRPAGVTALETPDGGRVPLDAGGATFVAPEQAGTLWLLRDGRRAGALVLDPEPEESDLTRLTPDELSAHLRGGSGPATVATDPRRWADASLESSGRRPVGAALLVLALLALLAETALTRAPARGRASGSPTREAAA